MRNVSYSYTVRGSAALRIRKSTDNSDCVLVELHSDFPFEKESFPMKKNILIILLFAAVFFPVSEYSAAYGQSGQLRSDGSVIKDIDTLRQITQCIRDMENQIRNKKEELRSDKGQERTDKTGNEIKNLNEQLASCRKNFERIAAGVKPENIDTAFTPKYFNWREELDELLGPLIRELKSMTERPREIEKLRAELAFHKNRMIPVKEAARNIKELIAADSKKLSERSEDAFKKEIEDALIKEFQDDIRNQLYEKIRKELEEKGEGTEEDRKTLLDERLKQELPGRMDDELPKRLKKELPNRIKEEKELEKKFREELAGLETFWTNKEQQISSQQAVTSYQLDQLEKMNSFEIFLNSTQDILRIFFKERGRNLLFSLLAFLSVLLILRLFHRFIYKFSPIHKKGDHPFIIRLTDVIYNLLTVAFAAGASVIVLYSSGDWVLLTLVIIFFLGIVWTAKQGFPRYWEQLKLLLNLGTVRENERLVYNGIPWKVVSLNLYSHLENPELKAGRIRMPLRYLIDLNSRPYSPDEPWFPCRVMDWVILSDGTFGRVVSQTPDMVQLFLFGNSRKTYLTEEFLRLNPTNLSTGFCVGVTFGIDYSHQSLSTQEIPDRLKEMLTKKLAEASYGQYILNLNVEFKEAGVSSLDIEIFADFSGQAAQYRNSIHRFLQRGCVEACNEHNWIIPFTQITLHTAKES